MPESRVRKTADAKNKRKAQQDAASPRRATGTVPGGTATERSGSASAASSSAASSSARSSRSGSSGSRPVKIKQTKIKAPGSRRWVPPTFITVGLLGVAWLVTYYIAGQYIPFMAELRNWNILIGMGGMAAAFGLATLWK